MPGRECELVIQDGETVLAEIFDGARVVAVYPTHDAHALREWRTHTGRNQQ